MFLICIRILYMCLLTNALLTESEWTKFSAFLSKHQVNCWSYLRYISVFPPSISLSSLFFKYKLIGAYINLKKEFVSRILSVFFFKMTVMSFLFRKTAIKGWFKENFNILYIFWGVFRYIEFSNISLYKWAIWTY